MEEKDRANDDVNLQDEAVNDLPVPDAQAQQTQGGATLDYGKPEYKYVTVR